MLPPLITSPVTQMQDYLTRLKSAKAFLQELEELLAKQNPLAVVTFDLVDFRSVNDIYGLPNGDQVIAAVGQSISGVSESYRIGGNRFAVVVHDATQALTTAHSITRKIESIRLSDKPDYPVLRLKVRVGVAIYPKDARKLDDLLKVAHDAMFADTPSAHRSIIRGLP